MKPSRAEDTICQKPRPNTTCSKPGRAHHRFGFGKTNILNGENLKKTCSFKGSFQNVWKGLKMVGFHWPCEFPEAKLGIGKPLLCRTDDKTIPMDWFYRFISFLPLHNNPVTQWQWQNTPIKRPDRTMSLSFKTPPFRRSWKPYIPPWFFYILLPRIHIYVHIISMSQSVVSQEILKGLDHMHRNGIFHRDVKPENLLLLDDEAGPKAPKAASQDVMR